MWKLIALAPALAFLAAAGCAKNEPQNAGPPVILKIDGEPIYMDELEVLGRLALSKSNTVFDGEEGQQRYREIAPNLYETLIDIYAIKNAAAREGIEPPPAEVEAAVESFKKTLSDAGQLDSFMNGMGVDDERLYGLMRDRLAMETLQQRTIEEGMREPSDEDVKSYYYENHALFRHPQTIRVSHIFLRAGADEPPETRQKARERAEQIREMIGGQPGKTFVSLARKYSDDPVNAPKGGDMGFIRRGDAQIPESFQKAAFTMDLGDVSQPIETDLGWHIVWVTDHEQSLEEAEADIKKQLKREYASEYFRAWKRGLREKMDIERYFDPETFEVLDEPAGGNGGGSR